MATTEKDTRRWAVENRNIVTGETVRVIECLAEWTAKLLSENANNAFKANDRPHESYWIQIK
jgi:hypothetical protein